MPASYKSDRNFVKNIIKTSFFSPKITNKNNRKLLKKSLLKINYLIPNIKIIHKNLEFLEVEIKLIKNQILNNSKYTLYNLLYIY
jgi:hypothetical protein